MEHLLDTYHLRRYVNAIVDSTETSPSLAEMVHHHLEVHFDRRVAPPFEAWFEVHDAREPWLRLRVTDCRGYPDSLYQKGEALLRIGVNGALSSPEDDQYAQTVFGRSTFRTCRRCGYRSNGWLDYYGHLKLEHWETPDTWSA